MCKHSIIMMCAKIMDTCCFYHLFFSLDQQFHKLDQSYCDWYQSSLVYYYYKPCHLSWSPRLNLFKGHTPSEVQKDHNYSIVKINIYLVKDWIQCPIKVQERNLILEVLSLLQIYWDIVWTTMIGRRSQLPSSTSRRFPPDHLLCQRHSNLKLW